MENLENNNGQLQIELKEDVAQGIYANLAIIAHSSSEFIWSSTQSFSSYCGDFTYENGCGVYEEYYSAWGFLARWDTNVFTIYGWEKGDGYPSLSVRPVMEF